ncbi:MAG: tetratricopeptide repeat protein [Verrucomicrobiota bacterium]
MPRSFRREWRKKYRPEEPRRRDNDLYPSSSRHGGADSVHHHRRRKAEHSNLGNRLLWAGVSLILLCYLGFLVYSKVIQKPQPKTAANPPTAKPPEEQPVVPEDVASIAPADLDLKIRQWRAALKNLSFTEELIEEGKIDKAIERLNDTLETTPDNVEAKMALASALVGRKQWGEAEAILIDILATTPRKVETRNALANVLHDSGNYESAIHVAQWILDEDQLELEMHDLVAKCYVKTDRPNKAIPHYSKMVSLDPLDTVAANNLALTYYKTGNYEKAVKLFMKMLDKDSSNSITYFNLAVCYAHMNRTGDAVDLLSKAADLFGLAFVRTWISSEEFDPIKDKSSFKRLEQMILDGRPGPAEDKEAETTQVIQDAG